MAFHTLCGSDPFLDFIRNTYDAIPLRVPDKRIQPLSLFLTIGKRVRIVGDLAQLQPAEWVAPPFHSADLAAVSHQSTNSLSWSVVTDLLGPILTQMLTAAQIDITASLRAARARNDRVRLVLGGTKRSFVDPIVCALALQNSPVKLPQIFGSEIGDSSSKPLYITDSILTAKHISISSDDDANGEFAAKLESDLVGKLSPKAMLRRKSGLTITANEPFPFAFTCLQLTVNETHEVNGVQVHGSSKFLGATEAGAMTPPSHSILGEPDQMVRFDD
jgi:hypothetical protein